MNKFQKYLVATSMTSVLLFSGSLASAASFMDVREEHWAKDEIDFLVDQNILDDHNKMFHPNKTITKAQAAIILANALDLKTNNKKLNFKDVSKKHYAYKEILAVVNVGIFPNEKSFKPNEPLTRKEVADILVKAYKLQDLGNIEFKDVPKSSKWYEAITRSAENGIISGESDGTFKPNKKVTRAEFAIYIARAMNDDFLPTQYNIPMNVNPVVKLFDYTIKNPKNIPSLFTSTKDFGFSDLKVKELDVHELNQVGRLNGVTEFSVKFTIELNGKETSFIKNGYNELYFLVTKEGYMDYKIQSVSVKPQLKGDDSIAFTTKDAQSLFIESQKGYWIVVRGGDGLRNESTFVHNGTEYRYMAESLETKEKFEVFLGNVYTPEKVADIYKQLRFITRNGKLAQPNADGGSILNWEKATIKQTLNSTTVKKYELKVPLGESKEVETMIGELRFVPGQGWRVQALEKK
ncbi:S-layer homology domain-containing protein [Ureibacillus sp. NPDC094379]